MATRPRKRRTLPRRKWTNPLAWAVWNQRRLNKERGAITPPENCRYYYNFDGVDDYIAIPNFSPSGDFEIIGKVKIAALPPSSNEAVIGSGVGNDFTIFLNTSSELSVQIPSISGSKYLRVSLASEEIEFKLTKIADVFELTANGVSNSITVSDATQVQVENIGAWRNQLHFDGVIYDVEIYDSGTLIRDYAIDDNSTTIVDSANGQNGTLINGTIGQWEYICAGGAFTEEFTTEFD